MTDTVLKIFSYLPNPRVWKAVIAGRLGGVDVEVVGDKPGSSENGYGILSPENCRIQKNR